MGDWLTKKVLSIFIGRFKMSGIMEKLDGYKSYLLIIVAALFNIAAWMFGPADIAGLHLPDVGSQDLINILWQLGLLATGRSAVKKAEA